MKISPSAPVVVLAGAQVDLVAADRRLLGVALAAAGQLLALARALDDALDDALGGHRRARRHRLVGGELLGHLLGLVGVVGQQLRVERLAELGAVAVERVGLEREAPGQHVGLLAVLDASPRSAC